MNEILVNPNEFGIEETKANELIGNLPQIKSERDILQKQYDELILLDIEDSETAKKAKALRLLISKNRTQGINQWHKVTKDLFLKGGQFVDAIKRVEVQVNERMEAQLEEIENYHAKKESERKESLRVERLSILQPYSEFVPFGIDLSNLSDEDFQVWLASVQQVQETHEIKVPQEEEDREDDFQLDLDKLEIQSEKCLPLM
jgi:hypothetical protein